MWKSLLLLSLWGEYKGVTGCSFPGIRLGLRIPLQKVNQKDRRLSVSLDNLTPGCFYINKEHVLRYVHTIIIHTSERIEYLDKRNKKVPEGSNLETPGVQVNVDKPPATHSYSLHASSTLSYQP